MFARSHTHKVTLTDTEQFFYDQGGWGYRPELESPASGRTRGAILLAEAERRMLHAGAYVTWEADEDPMRGDFEPTDSRNWVAVLHSESGEILGSLGSVNIESDAPEQDPYARVIAAELASEAL